MARTPAAGVVRLGTVLATACAMLWAIPPAAALEASAALVKQLGRTGRAEVTLRYALPAAPGASARVVFGTLALEPPDRVRLDVPGTGERIVASGSGGAWLQPATQQLLRFGPQRVSPALRWWRVLLGDGAGVRERRLGPGRYALALADGAGVADSATVWLDGRGLPARLEVAGDAEAVTYRLSGWRFPRARGEKGFRLLAPAGYETVELP